jgi:hypothetical protein
VSNSIVFYISGHGFGHASRDIEVINALQAAAPERPIVVRTAAARWLFDLTLRRPVDFHAVECDTGIVQIDSLHLDAGASVRRAAAFHAGLDARAASEARFLRAAGAGLVVGDIPALAFLAAARAGVPSIALGTFTWDWIYEAYPEFLDGAPELVPSIRRAHRHAEFALRLPMWGGFDGFRAVRDIPFVARHGTNPPGTVRERLGLPRRRPLVLLSFGGYGLTDFDLDAFAAAAGEGCALVTTDQVGARAVEGAGSPAVTMLRERAIYDAGCRYEDLVAAVDVVATKPGYGIIAECIANRTSMLYTSRGRFAEYDVLAAAISRYLRSAFIPQEDLYAGRWAPYLASIARQGAPPERPPTNGAEVAARAILDVIA